MKKAYIAPSLHTYEFRTDGMLALSTINGGAGGADLGSGNFESGEFEICTNKKDQYWESEW